MAEFLKIEGKNIQEPLTVERARELADGAIFSVGDWMLVAGLELQTTDLGNLETFGNR